MTEVQAGKANFFVQDVVWGIMMITVSISCSQKDSVCGVCAAVCYTETGRFDGVPEYVCEKTRQMLHFTQAAYANKEQG